MPDCPYCENWYATLQPLSRHMKKDHKGKEPN